MHPDQLTLDVGALGRRIAALRHESGLSQRRLAEAAGVSHGYIALLELGRLPSPGKFRLDAVAHALGLRTSDALTAAAPPPEFDANRGSADDPTAAAARARAGSTTPTAAASSAVGGATPIGAIGNVLGNLDQL